MPFLRFFSLQRETMSTSLIIESPTVQMSEPAPNRNFHNSSLTASVTVAVVDQPVSESNNVVSNKTERSVGKSKKSKNP